jgi:hypothetical protein
MEPFDLLRREATKLERSLEDKIARYHQVRKMTWKKNLFLYSF